MSDCDYCIGEIHDHEMIECITAALDAKDPYTAGHSQRVSDMAMVSTRSYRQARDFGFCYGEIEKTLGLCTIRSSDNTCSIIGMK